MWCMTNCLMLVAELSTLFLFLGFVQQCGGGSSSALDSFLEAVLKVQQTLPQRSRRNVVKRPGVSLDHEDLQELQGVNTDMEDEAKLYTGLDEASILRELQEVSRGANLSKRQSEDGVFNVMYNKAQLHEGSPKGARKNTGPKLMQIVRGKQLSNKGNARLLTGMKQLPIYSSPEDRSRYKVENKYELKNNLAATDYGVVTLVKFQPLPKHKYREEKEKAAINVDAADHVKVISNRKENIDGNYETHSGKSEIVERLNTAAPYEKINDVPSKSHRNENHFADTFREDSIVVSQQITGAPAIRNSIHKIRPMNNYGSTMEESWKTNVERRPEEEEEPQSIKEKGGRSRPGYLSYMNNYNDNYNMQANYEDAEQFRQKVDFTESQSTRTEPRNHIHFHEIDSGSSMVDPYKEVLFQDPKLVDNENLINSMDSVTLPAKHHSPSFVPLIHDSGGVGPTPKSAHSNNVPNTYRHFDVARLGTKDVLRRNFIRRHPYRDSLVKEKVSNDEYMFAHKKRFEKNNIDGESGEVLSNYPEIKEPIRSQYVQDIRKKFVGKDPEILSIYEADMKYQGGYEHTLADLINGNLVTDIVRSIMNKVISNDSLRQHFASGFGAITKGKSGRSLKLAPTAEEMYCESRCTVERRADKESANNGVTQSKCLALPVELKEFLKWMLEGGKEDVHSENENLLMPDQLVFYSARMRESFTTKQPEVADKTYDPTLKKKMQLVLQLLAEYEQLNDDEKGSVSKVHHYLQEELERLQGVPTEASNATNAFDVHTTSMPLEPINNFTNVESEPIRFSDPETTYEIDLIKKQLELLGLGNNAQLGQRLSDRFVISTEPDFNFSPLPHESISLPPLLDNYDSAFK